MPPVGVTAGDAIMRLWARAVIANPQTAFRFANILLVPEAADTLPEGANRVARGGSGNDEFTALPDHFNQFVGKTRNIVIRVGESTAQTPDPV